MEKLSIYDLSIICEYISEEDVQFLYMTGSKQVQKLLSNSALAVASLIPMYDNFRNIKTLQRIVMDDETVLPSSLTHIGIIITDLEPIDTLFKLPMNLTKLSLIDWGKHPLALLPKTMQHLKLTITEWDSTLFELPQVSLDEVWMDTLEIGLPNNVETLHMYGVLRLIVTQKNKLEVKSDRRLEYYDTTNCTHIVAPHADHVKMHTYYPSYNGDDERSSLYLSQSLMANGCIFSHEFKFTSTLTTVNLGTILWYTINLLPSTIISLSAVILNGDPSEDDKGVMAKFHNEAMEAGVTNIITFPPKLRVLNVKLHFNMLATTSRLRCDIGTLPTTLVNLSFIMMGGYNVNGIIQKLVDHVPLCLDIEKVAITTNIIKYSPKPVKYDISRLTKLQNLWAPVYVDMADMPRSLRYIECFAISNIDNISKTVLLKADAKFMGERANEVMRKCYTVVKSKVIWDDAMTIENAIANYAKIQEDSTNIDE